ncbi:hypothetical protein [Geminisphaera colitermitum]|uniref:hypothetical protein n=1 Tax=Geminisphaera colitermitum TaxID=1148786 RepID=UPI000158D33F|nr:hypothetical protein [Geminisphaera colitermitum]
MNRFGKDTLERALSLLGEVLASRGHPSCHFVVCGGSSLLALGLISHTATRDVDVLARLEARRLVQAKPLPPEIITAADAVRSELNLPADWFNTGPADDSFFLLGFPTGIEDRLTNRSYGPVLTIGFVGRYDQIHFKLYAAADQGPGRHVADLRDLNPTADELLAAARWTCLQDPSEGFLFVLSDLLRHLGHADLAAQL